MVVATRTSQPSFVTLNAFVDGGYVRSMTTAASIPVCNPSELARIVTDKCGFFSGVRATLARTFYFDAERDEAGPSDDLVKYWNAIESQPDTHLGIGWLRGKPNRKGLRQKAVDTLLAVEMLTGAFTGRYDAALLIAGDADYVPVVNEVRRAGPHVVLAAATDPTGQARFEYSAELRRAADRFIELPSIQNEAKFGNYFPPLIDNP